MSFLQPPLVVCSIEEVFYEKSNPDNIVIARSTRRLSKVRARRVVLPGAAAGRMVNPTSPHLLQNPQLRARTLALHLPESDQSDMNRAVQLTVLMEYNPDDGGGVGGQPWTRKRLSVDTEIPPNGTHTIEILRKRGQVDIFHGYNFTTDRMPRKEIFWARTRQCARHPHPLFSKRAAH